MHRPAEIGEAMFAPLSQRVQGLGLLALVRD